MATMNVEIEETRLATEEDINKLSDGLLAIYQEPLEKVSANLNELTSKQTTLIDSMKTQNKKLQLTENNDELKTMFSDMQYCKEQLVQIKKQMASSHDRLNKLKVRAQNVLIFAKNKQLAKVAQLEHEQKLIGGNKT